MSTDRILRFFAYEHLPPKLQEVSKPCGELAQTFVDTLPSNPERTVALRKLLEAKDAAVRALIAKADAVLPGIRCLRCSVAPVDLDIAIPPDGLCVLCRVGVG